MKTIFIDKPIKLFSIVFGFIILIPNISHAACSNPPGQQGSMSFTSGGTDIDAMMACNGTDWLPWAGWSVTGYPAPQFSSSGSAVALGDLTDVNTVGYTNGEVLMYSAGAGVWVPGTGGGGGATPGGTDTYIQFNSGGSTLDGTADLTWTDGTNTLTTVNINYSGMLADTSDRRLKDNITPLPNSLEGILALQGYSFTMKDDETGAVEYGLMAQDVQPVFPELVMTKEDGMMSLNYIGMIAPLVEAVKAQQAQIDDLQARLQALEARYAPASMPSQEQTGEQ